MTDAPADGPFPVEEHTSHRAALVAALDSTPRLPRDAAAVSLALTLAGLLDDAVDRLGQADDDDSARDFHRSMTVIDRLSFRYLQTLDRLGMSPSARPAIVSPGDRRPDPADAALNRLQSAAAGAAPGQHPGAALDPAVADALTDE